MQLYSVHLACHVTILLTPQAPISVNCALKFDKKSCKTLNSLLRVIKVFFFLHDMNPPMPLLRPLGLPPDSLAFPNLLLCHPSSPSPLAHAASPPPPPPPSLQHPLLQLTEEIVCLPEDGYLLTVQPLMHRGSLKDLIYQVCIPL